MKTMMIASALFVATFMCAFGATSADEGVVPVKSAQCIQNCADDYDTCMSQCQRVQSPNCPPRCGRALKECRTSCK